MTERNHDASGLPPSRVYSRRFEGLGHSRRLLWETLCRHFFSKWIPRDSSIVDIAAGHCEFINAVEAARRIAVDINPDSATFAGDGVEVHTSSVIELDRLQLPPVDVVFASNLFEHLPRPEIVQTIRQVRTLLRPGGRFLILQPNIRFIPRDYWMFFDHITPVDDRALCEVLEVEGFRIETCIPRFLPYTTKTGLPQGPWIVRLYLALPLAWRFFGAQAFIVAVGPA